MMKRVSVLALVFVFCCAGAVLAGEKKIQEGTIMVGGASTFGLMFGKHEIEPDGGDSMEVSTTAFNLAGYGGYFFMDKAEIGPILGINYAKMEMDEDAIESTGKMTIWDIGVQGAYIWDSGKKEDWAPFAMLALEYLSGKLESEYEIGGGGKLKNDAEISGWSITPRGGIMLFLHKRFAVDASIFIKYISASGSTKNGDKADFDLTSTNYGIMIGLDGFI